MFVDLEDFIPWGDMIGGRGDDQIALVAAPLALQGNTPKLCPIFHFFRNNLEFFLEFFCYRDPEHIFTNMDTHHDIKMFITFKFQKMIET